MFGSRSADRVAHCFQQCVYLKRMCAHRTMVPEAKSMAVPVPTQLRNCEVAYREGEPECALGNLHRPWTPKTATAPL